MEIINSLKPLVAVAIAKTTSMLSRIPEMSGYYSTKILGGHLRGSTLYLPQCELPAFPLGRYEPHLVELLEKHLSSGMICYDVGAHIGYLSLVMGQLVGEQGNVVSFEANPTNYQALKENIKENRIKNIKAINRAVSNKSEIVRFATFQYSLVGHIETDSTPKDRSIIEVEAISIDDFIFEQGGEPPDLIKIDVEGAEEQVINGLTRTLSVYHPIIIAEVRNKYIDNLSNIANTFDYSVKFLNEGWDMEKDGLADILLLPNSF